MVAVVTRGARACAFDLRLSSAKCKPACDQPWRARDLLPFRDKDGLIDWMDQSATIAYLSRRPRQVVFDRAEMFQILSVYGRFVAAGLWRDYAVDLGRDEAVFSIHRRASEMPLYRIVKRPALARKQGQYAIFGPAGQTLKRGADLAALLRFFDAKLLKLVE